MIMIAITIPMITIIGKNKVSMIVATMIFIRVHTNSNNQESIVKQYHVIHSGRNNGDAIFFNNKL